MSADWAKFWLSLIAAMAAAGWAVYVWRQEREKDRREESKLRAALYVTPFLLSCQDLQSRLYNLLDNQGLGVLKRRYSDNSYPEETLYLAACYFAWQNCLYRYTSYAADPTVVKLCEGVRDSFATSSHRGIDNFCLFRLQQQSLGRFVLERSEGEFGVEFQTMPFERFLEAFKSHDLAKNPGIQQTVAGLKEATGTDAMQSYRPRLACVQNQLVDLLAYIEQEEGICFQPRGEKRRNAVGCERENRQS